jgi:hypothetical protein
VKREGLIKKETSPKNEARVRRGQPDAAIAVLECAEAGKWLRDHQIPISEAKEGELCDEGEQVVVAKAHGKSSKWPEVRFEVAKDAEIVANRTGDRPLHVRYWRIDTERMEAAGRKNIAFRGGLETAGEHEVDWNELYGAWVQEVFETASPAPALTEYAGKIRWTDKQAAELGGSEGEVETRVITRLRLRLAPGEGGITVKGSQPVALQDERGRGSVEASDENAYRVRLVRKEENPKGPCKGRAGGWQESYGIPTEEMKVWQAPAHGAVDSERRNVVLEAGEPDDAGAKPKVQVEVAKQSESSSEPKEAKATPAKNGCANAGAGGNGGWLAVVMGVLGAGMAARREIRRRKS